MSLEPTNSNCSFSGPSSSEVFQAGAGDTIAALTVASLCTAATCLLYLFDVMQLLANYRDRQQAIRVFWLLGIYPFFCVTSVINLCVPRAAILVDFVNTIYFSICCLKFMHITQFYFGGRKQMLEYLQTNGIKFPLQSPPACCCCPCLPNFVIAPPLVSFIITVVAIDSASLAVATKEMESVFVLVRTISTSLAFYGLILIFRVSRGPLSGQSITAKFGLMKLAILFGHIQILVFNILGAFSVINCDQLWSSASKAAWINAACLAPEMACLFLLARRVYSRDDRPMSEYALIGESDSFPERARRPLCCSGSDLA
uniref:Organic solute transporter subunit alpha n=1 Tax=Macrostomum lignano TaxID=282301 RepID=A0A1I8IQ18_9PLAT